MVLFPVFSSVVFCLWALLLTSGPIYTPILTIPALISPVLTPLLSPLDGSTILILSEVCVGTVPMAFPTCDPVDAPVPTPSPPAALGPQRAFQLVAGLLMLGCAGIVLCTKGTIRLADGAGPTTPTRSDYPARLPSTSPPLPSFPPPPREASPGANWTPLSQSGAPVSLRRQVFTRNTGVSTSGRIFRPSPADSGYQGSPLLSRRAASKQHQSRLRVVASADTGSPTPSGPPPTSELSLGGSGGDDAPLEGPSSTPLFNPPVRQGGWTSCVFADDLFWAAGFTKRDSTPPDLLGKGVAANLETLSDLTVETPSLNSPLPLKNPISSSTGFSSVPGATTPVPVERTGVSDRQSARKARDAFLRLQAERGYAAPSRLYCNFANERSTPSPARSPNIQALRDILESGKATLRRLSEKRSAWLSSTDFRSRTLSRRSIVEEQASPTTPISSRTSFEPLEQCPINLEESGSTFDLPADVSVLVDGEMAFHGDEDDHSCPTPPFETVLANSRKGKSVSAARTSDVPASTSADIGLWLLVQAIDERGERSLYLDSEASFEATMSVDLTLGEVPSFLNDTYLSVCHSSEPVVVTQDRDTHPAPPFPAPTADVASSDALLEDTATPSSSPLSPLHPNPTPSPSAPPFETSLSFGRIDGFLKDILGTPVHRSSRPSPTFEAHNTRGLAPSSSLDGLRIIEDLPWLMDQSAPPSPIESRSGSPIPPFEEVTSRVRTRKAATAAQKDQDIGSTRDPETVSTGRSGRLETSMSFGRIADFLCDIWASPAHKFSNGMRFERSPGVNPSTSSASVIHIPEDMSYLVDQCIPNALAETSSGPAAFVLSLKNLPGMGPLPDVFYTESKSHSMLDLGSPHVSGPSPHVSGTSPHVSGPSPASLAPSRPCSSSSGSSLTMEIPENMTLLCEESLTDLGAVDGSWC